MKDETRVATREELIPTRKSLLSRLKDWQDQESWKAFFETYWRLIYSTARQAGLQPTEAEEVVQETVVSVCKAMPHFKYDPAAGSFKGWLMQLTRWRIQDEYRKRPERGLLIQPVVDGDEENAKDFIAPQRPGELERFWDNAWTQNLMDAALERVKQKVDPRQFQLFDLYVLQEWDLERICTFLKVNRGRIYVAKHRISKLVKKELQQLEEEYY